MASGSGGLFSGLGQIAQGAILLSSGGEEIYGRKPTVPDYPDIALSQSKSLAQNKAILPEAQEVATGINRFNMRQILDMLKEAIPDVEEIQKTGSANILSQLRGELPKDVQDFIDSKAASRSVAGGFSQSGMSRNLSLRDLGLTSLDVSNKALDSASRWLLTNRQLAPLFDVSKMFLSPEQQWNADQMKWQRNWLAEQVAAAPDPVARGELGAELAATGSIASGTDSVVQAVASYGASGMMGGGGGAGGGLGGMGGSTVGGWSGGGSGASGFA